MGHGPVRTLASVINKMVAGSIFYPLNSQDQLVVVFIADNAVVTNTGEIYLGHRPIRYCGEWTQVFPIDWDSLKNGATRFNPDQFQEGVEVIWISEDWKNARVEILIKNDEASSSWLTDDMTLVPYSEQVRLIPTGQVFEIKELGSDDSEEDE